MRSNSGETRRAPEDASSGPGAVVIPLRPSGGPHEPPPCVGRQSIFFAGDRSSIEFAKNLCRGCGRRDDCLDEALGWPPAYHDGTGVWGATTAADRRAIRRARHGGAVA